MDRMVEAGASVAKIPNYKGTGGESESRSAVGATKTV